MELPTTGTSTDLADGDVAIRYLHAQEEIRRARARRRWITAGVVLASMFVLMVGCGIAVGAASAGSATPTADAAPAASATPTPAPVAVTAPEPPAATTAPVTPEAELAPVGPFPPAAAFGNGTWSVGDEVAAGTYRSAGPTEGAIKLCYVDSKAGDTIVSQEVSADGPVRITVTDGQTVKASGCQQFTKVG